MPERWPDLAGRIDGERHVLPVRVYFEDTDFGGMVYHANFLKYCERGRSDFLRLLGIHHHRLEDLVFVVRRMVCDFRQSARIDDLLEVETRFVELGGARIEIVQRVLGNGEALFEAAVTVALVDRQGRPRRIPPAMASVMNFHKKSVT
jgi:acyl-CoA thioester hydrolase